jgi:hypothetical protein
MGVRFACHVCAKQLNIKQELAGRRGICPECGTKFRIPAHDAEKSLPVDEKSGSGIMSMNRLSGSETRSTSDSGKGKNGANVVENVPRVGVLADSEISTWYVRPPSGGQYGPATTEILRQWISEGRVASTALLWREGWPQWRESREVLPGLAEALPSVIKPVNPVFGTGSQGNGALQPLQAPTSVASSDDERTPQTVIGREEIGVNRRESSLRRSVLVGVLSMVSLILIVALVVIVKQSG